MPASSQALTLLKSFSIAKSPVLHAGYLPFPNDYPIARFRREFSFDAAEKSSLARWILSGTALFDKYTQTIALTADDENQAGSIFSQKIFPTTFRNWRIEVVLTKTRAHSKTSKSVGAPAFGIFVATPSSIISSLVDNRLTQLKGFLAWMPIWYDGSQFVISFSNFTHKSFPAFGSNMKMPYCGIPFAAELFSNGTIVILQYVEEHLTLVVAPMTKNNGGYYKQNNHIACQVNRLISGFDELIGKGGLALGVGGFTQGYFSAISVKSLTFFTLESYPREVILLRRPM